MITRITNIHNTTITLAELRTRLAEERAALAREHERCLAREISILQLERRRGMLNMLEIMVHELEQST